MRASLASGTTQTTTTTAQSFLLATGLGGGDKISATFGTFRTATTVATSVAASDLYRGDSSSMAPSVSESSYWDNESSAGSHYHPYGKLASSMRDRKPSEVGNYDLTRVVEEDGGGEALDPEEIIVLSLREGPLLFRWVRASGLMIL